MADKEKVKGKFNEAAGSVKQGIGSVTGDEQMQAEGQAQEAKGKGQGFVGDVKEKARAAKETVKGTVDAAKDAAHDDERGRRR
jgi:uncharacterized protein YjbJ (UPF0337 family)